jgi:hypothetical protein
MTIVERRLLPHSSPSCQRPALGVVLRRQVTDGNMVLIITANPA